MNMFHALSSLTETTIMDHITTLLTKTVEACTIASHAEWSSSNLSNKMISYQQISEGIIAQKHY